MNTINQFSDVQFVLFVIAVFLGIVQLTSLAAHVTRGAGASLIPGILAVVLFIVVFVVLG